MKKPAFSIHGNKRVRNEHVRGIPVHEDMGVKLRTQIEIAERSASFEKKGKGEVIRCNSKMWHTSIKKQGAMVVGIVDEAAQHDVPKKSIVAGVGVGKESVCVRNGAKRSVVGDEVGEEMEIEVKVGSEDGGMNGF